MKVDLEDPRDRQDPAVQTMRAQLMKAFQDAANSSSTGNDDTMTPAAEPLAAAE
jgi:hypothetical protein